MTNSGKNSKPRILGCNAVAQSRLFRIEEVQLEFSNGTLALYERVQATGSGAVMIVAMPDDDHVLLVREYAVGTERYELGFPKGRLEADELPESAANRELMEETGFAANKLQYLRSLTVAPGYFSHETHVVLATDLHPQPANGDEPEPVEVVQWPLARLPELLQRDDFSEARSIAALLLIREHD
mgnify:CR=1 FL=1